MNNKVNSFNDLENRCLEFSLNTKSFCRTIKQDVINQVYISQITRSSSSIGANYIEANEKLGDKDLLHKLKIARKEAKETIYWLQHFDETEERDFLIDEADQLRKILSSILTKLTINNNTNHLNNITN
jgi:four helix bundle protein